MIGREQNFNSDENTEYISYYDQNEIEDEESQRQIENSIKDYQMYMSSIKIKDKENDELCKFVF